MNNNLLVYKGLLEEDPFVSLEEQVELLYVYSKVEQYFKKHGLDSNRWDFEEISRKLLMETRRHTNRILGDQLDFILEEEKKSNSN